MGTQDWGSPYTTLKQTNKQSSIQRRVSELGLNTGCAVYVNFLTPDMTQEIPLTNHWAYAEPQLFPGNAITLAAKLPGARGDVPPPAPVVQMTFNNIQLNSIPSRVYIFASKADTAHTVTTPDTAWPDGPKVPIIDDTRLFGLIRLGNRYRCSGSVEFNGFDTTVSPAGLRRSSAGVVARLFTTSSRATAKTSRPPLPCDS